MQYNFRLSLAALAIANVLTTNAHANVIISEYIEGSSNNKAIELVNLSDTSVDLSGYSLETYANGKTTPNTPIFTLSGSLAPKATYVIGDPSANAEIKAKSQVLRGLGFNGDDALVLKRNGVVVDSFGRVGEQPKPAWGSTPFSTLDKTLRRKSSVTTGDVIINDAFDPALEYTVADRDDITDLGLYNGQAGGVVEVPKYQHGNCGEAVTLISAVQGSGAESPLKGKTVTLEAVVTASMPGKDGLGGFYVQQTEATYDSDVNTSEGIFIVDTQSAVSVAVGQKVRVSGVVEEGFNQTQLNKLEGLSICGNEPLPAAKTIALPMATTTAFEPLEGMLVQTEQSLVVTDNYGLGRYNEVVLATERLFIPTQIAKPGDDSKAIKAQNALNQITLDDGKNKQNIDTPYPAPGLTAENTLRVGDTVEPLTAVLGYGFSKYRLHPVTDVKVTATNPRTNAPVFAKPGDYQIASFNVLNYFNGDGAGAGYPTARGASTAVEFTKQRAKVIAAIAALNADVVGLLEVENDGFGPASALQDLINGLNDNAKADVWAFVDLKATQVGTDAITSAIIYRKDKVEEAATAAFTTTAPFDYGNRAPVAQAFRHKVSGDTVQVVVAHLRSKGSCPKDKADVANNDIGDGQGCWNGNRVEAAKQLSAWLATNPTQLTLPTGQSASAQPTLILGDINAYLMEDPITAFADNGYTEVSNALHGPKQYSYVFGGESGSLDHAFANASLMAQISDVTEWHINADEPLILDYNEEFKSDVAKANFYAATPYRSSDHDPMIVSVKFSRPSIQAQNFTLSENAVGNTLVGTLKATGLKDITNYRLSGTDAAMFSINAQGELRLAATANPDFETKANLEILVEAQHSGGLWSTPVAVKVAVTDEAELPTLTITETNTAIMVDAPQGTVLAQLSAKAVDETATIKSIVLSGANGFAVENNAIVVKGTPAVGTSKLTVTVTDSKGKTASKTVDVYAAGTESAGGSTSAGLMAMLAGLLVWRRRTSAGK
jgi:hypothetical protein